MHRRERERGREKGIPNNWPNHLQYEDADEAASSTADSRRYDMDLMIPPGSRANGTAAPGTAPGSRMIVPMLPPAPPGLSQQQLKRRHIVAAIVHSENSYVATLQRLVNVSTPQLPVDSQSNPDP